MPANSENFSPPLAHLLPSVDADEVVAIERAVHNITDATVRGLGSNLCSFYLTGSLTSGDFHRDSSDIDFTAITNTEIDSEQESSLQAAYTEVRTSGHWWDSRTEGVFLTKDFCAEPNTNPTRRHALKTSGELVITPARSDWIVQLKLAQQNGIWLAGEVELQAISTPVTTEQLLKVTNLSSMPFIKRPEADVQPARTTALHVLSACRIAYTRSEGTIVSKVTSADWAKNRYPDYSQIIEKALLKRGDCSEVLCHDAYDFIDILTNTI